MNICIFEDEKYINFFPLTLSRPTFELRVGRRTIRERIIQHFPKENVYLITRNYLKEVLSENVRKVSFEINKQPTLFINSRIVSPEIIKKEIDKEKKEVLFFSEDELVAAKVNNGITFYERLKNKDFGKYLKKHLNIKMFSYLWEINEYNKKAIEEDFNIVGNKLPKLININILNKSKIYVAENVEIMPGVVIDASSGPVIIDERTKLMPNCFLQGPIYLGRNCLIKPGTRIYGPSSIGNVCKVGGEIAESTFQGFSNKQHDGFIGHSYIGEWVNIGADTNNSDLKNNYKEVTVYINNKPVNTHLTFVGTFIGDHSKTAINTSINTGTVIGFSCNIFGEGFPPKFIPSFSWGGKRRFSTYKLEDAISTAEKVMSRRNVQMTSAYKKMVKEIFELTKKERVWVTE
ncbi:MAG: hypothetical protein B5M53_01450 [Candidatus Cloacimonas sp. 4484_209]|nr:MAG: hypothetical protein B5M53_01450 [Candidatus Cloacimonas sp. 4484_209]